MQLPVCFKMWWYMQLPVCFKSGGICSYHYALKVVVYTVTGML